MAIGWQQILIAGIVVLVLFGSKGKFSSLMGDLGQGIRAFRLGMASDEKNDLTTKEE